LTLATPQPTKPLQPFNPPPQPPSKRHFVRDLTWSRHQLEELAERRFRAAQDSLRAESAAAAAGGGRPWADGDGEASAGASSSTSFADLFKKVRVGCGWV